MRFLLGILGGAMAVCAVAAVLSENKGKRLEASVSNSRDFWQSRIARYYIVHVN